MLPIRVIDHSTNKFKEANVLAVDAEFRDDVYRIKSTIGDIICSSDTAFLTNQGLKTVTELKAMSKAAYYHINFYYYEQIMRYPVLIEISAERPRILYNIKHDSEHCLVVDKFLIGSK